MKEYMMIFRNERKENTLSPEQINAVMKQWQGWIAGIAAKGNYSGTNRLLPEGKTIRANKTITDGPYAEGKELLGGYLIVKANSIDEAMKMAAECPGLLYGGSVEVRSVMGIDYDFESEKFLAEVAQA